MFVIFAQCKPMNLPIELLINSLRRQNYEITHMELGRKQKMYKQRKVQYDFSFSFVKEDIFASITTWYSHNQLHRYHECLSNILSMSSHKC